MDEPSAPGEATRRPRNRPPFPTSARVHELYADLLSRPNVTGCFVGRKRTGNRYTRDLAIICAVQDKVERSSLGAEERVPEVVEWQRHSRGPAIVRTDVQHGGESGFQDLTATAGPGDLLASVSFPNGPSRVTVSTVGIAMRHPRHGQVITTAGHSVQGMPGVVVYPDGQRPLVRLQNVRDDGSRTDFTGEVAGSTRVAEADYALIIPHGEIPARNLYRDVDSVSGLYIPQPDDVGKAFFALAGDGLKQTRLRGVFGVLDIDGFPMRDLLLTDFVTQAGDSGCALIDASFRVCGLLVGFATVDGIRRSVFMSAFWALGMENGELF